MEHASLHLRRHTDLLEKTQRCAVKIVPEVKELSYRERLAVMELSILEEKRKQGDMM